MPNGVPAAKSLVPVAALAQRLPRKTIRKHGYTADEFFRLPLPEQEKWELVKGELVLAASPIWPHQRILARLVARLEAWLERHPVAWVVGDWDVKFLLDETRRPDLMVVLKEGSRLRVGTHGEGAPDLIVEIVSPGQERRDLVEKRDLYERCGVREYWVVDCSKRRIHQFLPDQDGRYVESLIAKGALRSRVLKGFSLKLRELFKVLDEVPA
jgi:Uma2 family endonuclease